MIGRHDILFATLNSGELAQEAVKLVRLSWTDAIVEDPLTGDSLDDAMLGLVEFPSRVFIYRNTDAKQSWEANGSIPENDHSMIDLAMDAETLAVIVDDPKEPEIANFLSSIGELVSDIGQLRLEAA